MTRRIAALRVRKRFGALASDYGYEELNTRPRQLVNAMLPKVRQ